MVPLAPHATVPSCTILPETQPQSRPSYLNVFGPEGNPIRSHFQRVLDMPVLAQIGVFTIYAILAKIVLGICLEALPGYSIMDQPGRESLSASARIADKGVWMALFTVTIAAPLMETLINQWFILWLALRTTRNPVLAIWLSTILFGLCHVAAGWFGFAVASGVGFFLAVAFIHGRRYSRKRAFWTTAAIHAGVNGIALAFALLTG